MQRTIHICGPYNHVKLDLLFISSSNPGDAMSSFQATCQCLKISEMVFEIASHLDDASDLYSASLSNRLWYSTLVPLRVRQILVHLKHIPSLLSFFQSDKAASYHCQTLRVSNEFECPRLHSLRFLDNI